MLCQVVFADSRVQRPLPLAADLVLCFVGSGVLLDVLDRALAERLDQHRDPEAAEHKYEEGSATNQEANVDLLTRGQGLAAAFGEDAGLIEGFFTDATGFLVAPGA